MLRASEHLPKIQRPAKTAEDGTCDKIWIELSQESVRQRVELSPLSASPEEI